jgi:hypothetical protein
MQITAPDPADTIWINLLCPAQAYHGVCTQKTCGADGFRNGGSCALNGKPWAPICVIPQSHPVHECRREIAALEAEARRNLQ